jgi:hypothetical protein
MRRLRIAGAIACLLALTTATACAGAAGQTADALSTAAAPFSAYSSGSAGGPAGSSGSADSSDSADSRAVTDAARADWLTKGGCRPLPPASTSFTQTPDPVTATDAAGPAVLTVSGRFAPDRTVPVTLDLAQLDAMPQVECTVNDREAEGRDATFRGVLVADLLTEIGAQPETTLHTAALNDYAVDLPVTDIRDLPVLMATRLDGQPMSVAHYGPLRVIYPTTGYNLDPTVYDPRKIWQLSTVDVA